MPLILPCEDPYLRAVVTQRPPMKVQHIEFLTQSLESALTSLLESEI
jgi:hypothetical protein